MSQALRAVTRPVPPIWNWSDRVRKVRRDMGLSQTEFANRIGASRGAVGLWEAGNYQPRDVVEFAKRIEREFGVPATWMLGLTDTECQLCAARDSNPVPAEYAPGTVTSIFDAPSLRRASQRDLALAS